MTEPHRLAAVPSLDAIADDPAKARGLSREVRGSLLLRLAAALTACAVPDETSSAAVVPAHPEPERLLTPDEAARALNVTKSWLYAHARKLPFTRRLSRKCLRFSEPGLYRWQAAKR